MATLARTIAELQPLEPSFVSVTYRGGAESRQRTFDLVSGMLHTTKLNPMAHIICVAHTRLELADILVSLRKAGIENLMALGGDPPDDPSAGPGELAFAAELVELARAIGGSRSVWPPIRPATPVRPTCRATVTTWRPSSRWPFGVTQFFFEASEYESLKADLRERGVDTPVLPGILPVTSLSTMARLGAMGASAPSWMEDRLRAADERGGSDAVRKEGVELATELCSHLLESGVPGLHFYTFNTSSATREMTPHWDWTEHHRIADAKGDTVFSRERSQEITRLRSRRHQRRRDGAHEDPEPIAVVSRIGTTATGTAPRLFAKVFHTPGRRPTPAGRRNDADQGQRRGLLDPAVVVPLPARARPRCPPGGPTVGRSG